MADDIRVQPVGETLHVVREVSQAAFHLSEDSGSIAKLAGIQVRGIDIFSGETPRVAKPAGAERGCIGFYLRRQTEIVTRRSIRPADVRDRIGRVSLKLALDVLPHLRAHVFRQQGQRHQQRVGCLRRIVVVIRQVMPDAGRGNRIPDAVNAIARAQMPGCDHLLNLGCQFRQQGIIGVNADRRFLVSPPVGGKPRQARRHRSGIRHTRHTSQRRHIPKVQVIFQGLPVNPDGRTVPGRQRQRGRQVGNLQGGRIPGVRKVDVLVINRDADIPGSRINGTGLGGIFGKEACRVVQEADAFHGLGGDSAKPGGRLRRERVPHPVKRGDPQVSGSPRITQRDPARIDRDLAGAVRQRDHHRQPAVFGGVIPNQKPTLGQGTPLDGRPGRHNLNAAAGCVSRPHQAALQIVSGTRV